MVEREVGGGGGVCVLQELHPGLFLDNLVFDVLKTLQNGNRTGKEPPPWNFHK